MLYWRLSAERIVDLPRLSVYFLLGAVLMMPFILTMHKAGDYLYPKAVRLLID
jgi:hypothetical protein